MKSLLLFPLLLLFLTTSAQQIKVDAGSLIIHTFYDLQDMEYDLSIDSFPEFSHIHEISKPFPRCVFRPQIGISYIQPLGHHNYFSTGIFTGQDCLHCPIFGMVNEIGWTWKYVKLGGIIGGYFHNKKTWEKENLHTRWLVPLIGIDFTLKKEFNNIGIEFSNKITPIMTIHNISITYKLK